MASNSFGTIFRITTWGESHGKAIGVVIDGCPAGIEITEEEICFELARRAPGNSPFTSPRKEPDRAEILSGIYKGKSTGAPISLLIPNHNPEAKPYQEIEELLRPGHANFTYLEKYGIFDSHGGGRASARETACRVAAGAIARKFLSYYDIHTVAYLQKIGEIESPEIESVKASRSAIFENPLYTFNGEVMQQMMACLTQVKKRMDSIGGVVEFKTSELPVGLGEPVYEKLSVKLAQGMLSIPAAKGFELGSGFKAATMFGSTHNDSFILHEEKVQTASNNAGGMLGGISNGMPVIGRVIFKPTSSIQITQKTLTIERKEAEFRYSNTAKHDPCVAIRAVPVVDAMVNLVLADLLLMSRTGRV